MKKHLAACLALSAALGVQAQTVRTSPEAFPIAPPALPVAPRHLAPAPAPLPPAAAPAPLQFQPPPRPFSLEAADKNVRSAFARWARERGATVQWLLSEDVPIDAPGPVRNSYPDLSPAQFGASSYPDLVEAMTVVARASGTSRTPFVIREHDNTILVVARLSVRK